MSLVTVSELKRKSNDKKTPISKRFKFSKNVINRASSITTREEDALLARICDNIENKNGAEDSNCSFKSLKTNIKNVDFEHTSSENRSKFLKTIYGCLKKYDERDESKELIQNNREHLFEFCINLVENASLYRFNRDVTYDFFVLIDRLLKCLILCGKILDDDVDKKKINSELYSKRCLSSLRNFIKATKDKAKLVDSFLRTKLLWTILKLSKNETFSHLSINLCSSLMFPHPYLILYKNYLTCFSCTDSVKKFIDTKGEQARPIVNSVKTIFFENSPITKYENLQNFLGLFIFSCKSDEGLIFVFHSFLYNYLGIDLNYATINNTTNSLKLEENELKQLYLYNLTLLSEYNINLNIKYKFNKTQDDEKDNFILFIQKLTTRIIKSYAVDTISLSIIRQVFLLDPSILESNLSEFLPGIVTRSKDVALLNGYTDVMITIVEVMFKMSRGIDIVTELLQFLKESLGTDDANDYEIEQKNIESISSKEVFPEQFCNVVGKLSSELVSWQHISLLKILIEYLNEIFESSVRAEKLNYSTNLLIESTCSILMAFFQHSKIADQNVPETIYHKFDEVYKFIESSFLVNFSKIVFKFREDNIIIMFLELCYNYGHLKILLNQYQPHYICKIEENSFENVPFQVFSYTALHQCLSCHKWKKLFKLAIKNNNEKCSEKMQQIIIQNCAIVEIVSRSIDINQNTLDYLLENYATLYLLPSNNIYLTIILNKLNRSSIKSISKVVIEICLKYKNVDENFTSALLLFKNSSIVNKKDFFLCMTYELLKNIWIKYDKKTKNHISICEQLDCESFDIKQISKDVKEYDEYMKELISFNILKSKSNEVLKIIKIIEEIPIQFLPEKVQNFIMFTLIVIKMSSKDTTDTETFDNHFKSILVKIFELSNKPPNFFGLFATPELILKILCEYLYDITMNNANHDGLKNIFLSILTKDGLDDVMNITKILIKSCENSKRENCSDMFDMFTRKEFQVLLLLYVTLSNVKKSSDTRQTINICFANISDFVYSYFKKIDWENLCDIKEHSTTMGDMLEPYSLLLNNFNKEEEKFNEYIKSLDYFLSVANYNLVEINVSIYHARGGCKLINVILNNYKLFEKRDVIKNQKSLFLNIWKTSRTFIENNLERINWNEVIAIALNNITLTCELSDNYFFNTFLVHELVGSENKDKKNRFISTVRNSTVTHKLWYCFLNANLKATGKNETRSAIVKEMVEKFYLSFKDTNTLQDNVRKKDATDNCTIIDESLIPNGRITRDFKLKQMFFDIIIEFVKTKKMILSSHLIDIILQFPYILLFNSGDWKHIDIFYTMFQKSLSLLDALLKYRSELLQDRWPIFFISYRKLVEILCSKSNSEKNASIDVIEKLSKLSHNIERITEAMVKNSKSDIMRITPYVIADIVMNFQKYYIDPLVKFHLQNCIYAFLELSDGYVIGFIMRNSSDSGRIVFKKIFEEYKKYHKYTGAS